MSVTLAKVEAEKNPFKGRDIVVYDAGIMESIIRTYAKAYAADALHENQIHIGKRAAVLVQILVKTSLHALIFAILPRF